MEDEEDSLLQSLLKILAMFFLRATRLACDNRLLFDFFNAPMLLGNCLTRSLLRNRFIRMRNPRVNECASGLAELPTVRLWSGADHKPANCLCT